MLFDLATVNGLPKPSSGVDLGGLEPVDQCLDEARVQVSSEVRVKDLSLGAVLGLAVGDVIDTDVSLNQPFDVLVDGRAALHGFLGSKQGKRAIHIVARKGEGDGGGAYYG